jgi:hypothetical protein
MVVMVALPWLSWAAGVLQSLIFTGDKGAPLRRSNVNRQPKWPESLAAIGAPGLHFHDRRHTGNHLAARTTTRTTGQRAPWSEPASCTWIARPGRREPGTTKALIGIMLLIRAFVVSG